MELLENVGFWLLTVAFGLLCFLAGYVVSRALSINNPKRRKTHGQKFLSRYPY